MFYEFTSRLLDLLISFTLIVFLSPLFIFISLILKFTGEGEILYKQRRVGKDMNYFNLYKFATMLKDSPKLGSGELTQFDDPRVLPLGKLLRKTKINELPQLINVLLGHMSLVGPRPQTQRYFNLFNDHSRKYIAKMRPGITGIGSIIFRDEESIFKHAKNPQNVDDNLITPYKGKLETWFYKNRTIRLYFLLIISTALILFFSKINLINYFYNNLPKMPKEISELIKNDKITN
tara:strand:- start:18 stop:719 length:702 start_codon:yes stop_codon:yes gene_type:complete